MSPIVPNPNCSDSTTKNKDWHITMASVGRKQTDMTGGKATDFQIFQ